MKDFFKKNLKTIALVVTAFLFASLALGHWGIFLIVMLSGGALAIMNGIFSRSTVAKTVFTLTVVCLLYTVLVFPKVDEYMSEHWPSFWSTLQEQRIAKDYEYGRTHAVAGNGMDAIDARNAKILEERDNRWYDSVTTQLMMKSEWTYLDSLQYRKLQLIKEQKKLGILNLKSGGVLEVRDASGSTGSTSSGGGFSKLLKVDITTPEPTAIEVPKGADVVIWVEQARYAGFDSVGTKHPGAKYGSSKDPYEDFYVGAGGYAISPRKGCTFPNAFPAPDLNMFATIYRSSQSKTWNMVPPEGKLTIPGSFSENVTVEFTINDRATTMEGNSGGLVIGYRFLPKSRQTI